ncbi:MAG: hypothetical protein JWP15_3250 [Alphaproteobacteria bacterium]|nr:hypothetical protein [Alphaproteobacteria bacterium]
MTDDPESEDLFAAEYALGLLSGDELARALSLARSDPDFRKEAGRWTSRLAPLLDEVAEAEPPQALWQRIAAQIDSEEAPSPTQIVSLRRRMNIWRAYGAAATALAASLAWLLVTRPPPPAPVPPTPAPMVASLSADGSPARLVATWNPDSRALLIAAAVAPAAAPGHAHQLWMIPVGGQPRPMGMMPKEGPMRAVLPAGIAGQLREGVTLAISIEPEGGSPTGLPTGPVIAAGKLIRT